VSADPKLPPDLDEEWRELLLNTAGVQAFIRENFGLYAPPADYAALRAENLRRTKAAEKKG
jgi:hypothetical protein